MSPSRRASAGGGQRDLVLRDVSVRYGSIAAVDGLDLQVTPGEIVALVGPSGCGKSSVLRAIAGLEPLTSGSVRFGGRDLAGVAIHRRDLGLMFQDHALFPNLDVAGNVAFGLRMHRWSRSRVRARVAELLTLVGLEGYGGRPVRALSGGEAQRVALARALAPQPGLLMLDEPLGALDRGLREQLTRDVRRLLTSLGQTALHVTHDQAEAFSIADRVAVMRAGRLAQVGTPTELWERPADAFVARFLGHPNVWPVRIDDDGTVTRVVAPDIAGAVVPGATLRLGRVDRESCLSATTGAAHLLVPMAAVRIDPAGGLRGRVDAVELREGTRRVTLATDTGPVVLTVEHGPVEVDQLVAVALDLTQCSVLPGGRDPNTEGMQHV